MYPTAEFLKMSELFIQDFDLIADTPSHLATFVVGKINDHEKAKLRQFLSEIIADRYSDEQLQKLWAKTRAEVGFPRDLRKVLTIVRDHMDRTMSV